jgi:bifunctional non-homologous end joining protein LigD
MSTTPQPMPRGLAPMLATSGPLPRDQEHWGFEVKWDGVRALAYCDSGAVELESRNLIDITTRYPELAGLATALGQEHRAVLDGEVVAFADGGRPSFGRLQTRMHVIGAGEVRRRMLDTPVVYFLFDVLWLDSQWLIEQPYAARRAVLEDLLGGSTSLSWQISPSHAGEGSALEAATREQGLEGVVAKRLDSRYELGRRSRAWVKVKHLRRQELVVCGWLPGERGRSGRIGALLLGYYDEGGTLRYAGRVGTGFTVAELDRLLRVLSPLRRDASPFATPIPEQQLATFVEPSVVAEVAFSEWTTAGVIRQASYQGVREDKDARDVRREP